MRSREIRLETLIGRTVQDAAGARVGVLEELRAHERDGELLVEEYVVADFGAFDRLVGWHPARVWLPDIVRRWIAHERSIRWDELDLADPERPRLRTTVAELDARGHADAQARVAT